MTKILNETRQRGGLWSTGKAGGDPFPLNIPPGEAFHSCRLTILSSDPATDASLGSRPSPGQTGAASLTVNWKSAGLSVLTYQVEAFSAAPGASSVTAQGTGFLPSQSGFHFDNSFPAVPDHVFNTPFGDLKIGNAANGLCGGMVYAALDYFNAGLQVPADVTPPSGGAVFDYIFSRLLFSFDLPGGVLRYVELMNPLYPDGQSFLGRFFAALNGRAWTMIRQEWPVIKASLDAGKPCPLGLIKVKSSDLNQVGLNHQVLATGYDLNGTDLTLFIYDPNFSNNDQVRLKLSTADPTHPAPVTYSTGETVYCFFHTHYAFAMPPGGHAVPGRILLFEQPGFKGRLTDVDTASPDLGSAPQPASLVVLSGNWSLYQQARFTAPFLHGAGPLVLGPGSYPNVTKLGLAAGAIASLKAVADPPNM